MPVEPIPTAQVLARWAYSEIADGTLAHQYDGRDEIERLRDLRSSEIGFENLSPGDRYCLAYLCISVRPVLWLFYVSPIRTYVETTLTKDQVGATLVVPQVASDELNGQPEPLTVYLARPKPAGTKDCRHVGLNAAESYVPSPDPITLGVCESRLCFVDGYHRAVMFLRRASESTTIRAYIPTG